MAVFLAVFLDVALAFAALDWVALALVALALVALDFVALLFVDPAFAALAIVFRPGTPAQPRADAHAPIV